MLAAAALPATLLALATPFQSSVQPVSDSTARQLKLAGAYRAGCPVPLRDLRVLAVTHYDWAGKARTGRLIVNEDAARPLARAFRQLYRLRYPIRHLTLHAAYGPRRDRPADGDISGSFECRQAVPSPCTGGNANGSWSNHAYGLAVDINPVENPYVGCGQSRDPRARRYRDRSVHRKGMVTRRVIAAFRSIGWGWGGSWAGNTKDYMHFSVTGR